jgi:hypothetical protein
MISQAFADICKEAQVANRVCLSLYRSDSWYGGPEEGGWWGRTTALVAHQEFPSVEAAEAAKVRVNELAEQLTKDSKKSHGDLCQRQIDWCEARGIDDPDTVFTFFVTVESELGSSEHSSDRHYC